MSCGPGMCKSAQGVTHLFKCFAGLYVWLNQNHIGRKELMERTIVIFNYCQLFPHYIRCLQCAETTPSKKIEASIKHWNHFVISHLVSLCFPRHMSSNPCKLPEAPYLEIVDTHQPIPFPAPQSLSTMLIPCLETLPGTLHCIFSIPMFTYPASLM